MGLRPRRRAANLEKRPGRACRPRSGNHRRRHGFFQQLQPGVGRALHATGAAGAARANGHRDRRFPEQRASNSGAPSIGFCHPVARWRPIGLCNASNSSVLGGFHAFPPSNQAITWRALSRRHVPLPSSWPSLSCTPRPGRLRSRPGVQWLCPSRSPSRFDTGSRRLGEHARPFFQFTVPRESGLNGANPWD